MSRPVTLSPVHKNNIIDVESSLSSDDASRLGSGKGEKPEQDTGDSKTAVVKVRHEVGCAHSTLVAQASVNDLQVSMIILCSCCYNGCLSIICAGLCTFFFSGCLHRFIICHHVPVDYKFAVVIFLCVLNH